MFRWGLRQIVVYIIYVKEKHMKAGDIVKVTSWGKSYSTNYLWFDKFKGELDYRWMICYQK